MTTTVRYVAPLLWQGVSKQDTISQAAPVVWAAGLKQNTISQAAPVIWTTQKVQAYIRTIQAVQWLTSPNAYVARKVTALQWTKDYPIMQTRRASALQWTQDPVKAAVRALTGVVWINNPVSGQLRQARAYTLQQSSTSGQLRQIRAYTLQLNRKPQTVGGLAGLWPLINAQAKVSMSASTLSVSAPTADSSKSDCNTTVVAAPIGSFLASYSGTVNLYYNRVGISTAFNGSNLTWLLGSIPSATTIRALLSSINSAYALALDPTDVNDGPVAQGATSLVLTAAAGSYVFQPGSTVTIQTVVALTTAVATTALPGFVNVRGNYVDPDLSTVITAPALPGFAPAFTHTSLLMHFDGTNGSTSMVDATGLNNPTATGTGVISTTKSALGGASLSIPSGTNSGVSVPSTTALQFPVGQDFTIEFFVYSGATTRQVLFSKNASGLNGSLSSLSNTLTLYDDGGGQLFAASGFSTATWYHLAVVRQGSLWSMYLNGALIASVTNATSTFGNNSAALTIGNAAAGYGAAGSYIDEFRVSAVARYTAPFTPPQQELWPDSQAVHLSSVITGSSIIGLSTSSATTINALIPSIALTLGINLQIGDVVNSAVAAGATSITLTTPPSGSSYVPNESVTLTIQHTALLMHFNGTNGATTTTDDAGHVATITAPGQLTTTQSVFGGSSFLTATTGHASPWGYVTIPDSIDLRFLGDFTIEFFIFMPYINGNANMILRKGTSFIESAPPNVSNGNTSSQVNTDIGQLYSRTGSNALSLPASTWCHFAMVKQGATYNFFLNGTLALTVAAGGGDTWGNNTSPLTIFANNTPAAICMDELRISKGIARYTANFTPPAAPFVLD